MKIVQVTLEDSIHSVLKDAAKLQRISLAELIREALAQWVARRTNKGAAA